MKYGCEYIRSKARSYVAIVTFPEMYELGVRRRKLGRFADKENLDNFDSSELTTFEILKNEFPLFIFEILYVRVFARTRRILQLYFECHGKSQSPSRPEPFERSCRCLSVKLIRSM